MRGYSGHVIPFAFVNRVARRAIIHSLFSQHSLLSRPILLFFLPRLSIFLRRRLLIVRFGRIDLHYSPPVIAYIIYKNFLAPCRTAFIIYQLRMPRPIFFFTLFSHLFFYFYLMQLITKDRANEPSNDCFYVFRCMRRTPGEKPPSGTNTGE